MSTSSGPSRRNVLQGASAAALVGTTVVACGGGSSSAVGGSSGATKSPGSVLGAESSIPVGGGTIFSDASVVVTQPESGTFKGFSTRCTHQGCAVTSVSDGFIVCPCHNSRFAVTDGAPTADSEATQPLATVAIETQGGDVVLG
jgi:nitrite reductase/ring-hydroxylating ferredoxin subunit